MHSLSSLLGDTHHTCWLKVIFKVNRGDKVVFTSVTVTLTLHLLDYSASDVIYCNVLINNNSKELIGALSKSCVLGVSVKC